MRPTNPFHDLIRRVRSGDEMAAAELVRQYEPLIRRTVRIRLRSPHLRRVLDSVDVCQSVLASFFTRAALGQFELDTPEDLLKLLVVMARNKLATQARKRQPNDLGDPSPASPAPDPQEIAAPDATPSHQVAARDLLQEFRRHLSPTDRQIADRRALGREWAEIAAEIGGSPDAVRKRFDRAVDRVARQLGLEDVFEE
jgi:RNA polymerase sigma-70 factor (ECF subfamily)